MTQNGEKKEQFDFIVCGAGASGSVIAARLAANPEVKVLLLEAGGSDDVDLVMDPNLWVKALGTDLHWNFIAESNPHLNGRAIPYSMGKVLGGGSSVNVLRWSRGHRADWDRIADELGDAAWGYDAVLNLYRHRIEDFHGVPDPAYRGSGGPVNIEQPVPHPFSQAFLDAAKWAGMPRFENANGRMMEADQGSALVDEIVHEGKRQSIFRSYTYPRMNQPNLTVLTSALVTRILFDHRRAAGVEYYRDGKLQSAYAQYEVVVSLGAIQTPKLLMQSGIGDEAELRSFGIPVLQKLAGVGRNLHDHVSLRCFWESTGKAMPTVSRGQAAVYWKTDPSLDAPNVFAFAPAPVTPEMLEQFKPAASLWSVIIGMRLASRGTVQMTGPNASDPLNVQPNYLAAPQDIQDLTIAIRQLSEIGSAAALRPYTKREVAQGTLDRADLEDFIRNSLGTFWHQSGTAKMGRDAMSVVDSKLRVYGVDGLRVADGSILPRVTTGTTMGPCVVIGERAAAVLQEEHDVPSLRSIGVVRRFS